jgi:NAD-dependent deacetylase
MDKEPFLVVLTGAGISAQSGVPTFRSNGGLWKQYRFEDLATPEAFAQNPELVWEFYQWRQKGVTEAQPNRAHGILAEIEAALGRQFLLVTQNVDDLHERGGSRTLLHMHGEIMKARCEQCGVVHGPLDYQTANRICEECAGQGRLRPHIVWFGEMPFYMPEIQEALSRASHFIAIGTSGAVYPAAQFVHMAKESGAKTALVNLDPADNDGYFDHVLSGNATDMMAKLWEEDCLGFFQEFSRKTDSLEG